MPVTSDDGDCFTNENLCADGTLSAFLGSGSQAYRPVVLSSPASHQQIDIWHVDMTVRLLLIESLLVVQYRVVHLAEDPLLDNLREPFKCVPYPVCESDGEEDFG